MFNNRNASSVNFGFQFQINVAIYFMFEFLKDISNLKVEGEKEDIEITFNDKTKYMIQAKSQTQDLYNNSDNSSKLKRALLTLSEADSQNVRKLFYASNMLNPLNTTTNEFERNDVVIKSYNELSPESKTKIDHQIERNALENGDQYLLNKDKLVIIRLPFFGEFESEKYKYIYEEAQEILSLMSDTLMSKHKTIVRYCESKFLNSSTQNPKITISKEDFCNWIILTEIESMDLSNNQLNIGIDETDYYEAYQQYSKYIDEKISSYENYSKVYALFNKKRQNTNLTISDFVRQERISLYNYFFEDNIKDENEITDKNKLNVYISQIFSYAILMKKSVIEKINKGANL